MVRLGRNGRCIRGVVEHAAHAHVEVVGVYLIQIDIGADRVVEVVAHVEDARDVGAQRRKLVEEALAEPAAVGEGR